ncbi:MAG: DUF1343 domain-containing protein [Gemmatimonadaceae bacterium]|nr:DUF1343 domain-containing protein [Gemmatimonadaceae bacterium]
MAVLVAVSALWHALPAQRRDAPKPGKVLPGISVLVTDSAALIAGKRVAVVTNQTGVDERGRSSVDRLAERAKIVALFAPEHGIRGEEDRPDLADGRDATTGAPIYSLYRRTTVGPSAEQLREVDVLVVDLQDIGTRTWTYVGVMLYTMQAAARAQVPVIICDRPNPITGARTEGALLDSALASTVLDTTGQRSNGFALWPMPLRHGLTMGELARFYRDALKLPVTLHVIPMANWRRAMWYDETGLPWVRPSPNLPSLESALLYPALVAFEASNLSVGRGTDAPFQRLGAPWLDADSVAALLNGLELTGVRFDAERVTPRAPTDGKFDGVALGAVRVVVTDRDRVQPARVGAALLWALARRHPGEMTLRTTRFDERFGAAAARAQLLSGADPDAVMDATLADALAFARRTRGLLLYR